MCEGGDPAFIRDFCSILAIVQITKTRPGPLKAHAAVESSMGNGGWGMGNEWGNPTLTLRALPFNLHVPKSVHVGTIN